MSTFGAESVEGVIDEVMVVTAALDKLGGKYRVVGVRQLSEVPALLASAREPVIWNLVEGLLGAPQDASLVPALCCAYGKVATGADSPCLALTLDKWRTKAVLREAGLPVPGGTIVRVGESFSAEALGKGPFIVKPAETDASEGIGSGSVFQDAGPGMEEAVKIIHRQFNQPALIEQYVGNREFNVSVVQDGKSVCAMPIAEIDFSAFEPGRPRIIDYAAKWLTDTFEYKNTQRILPAPLSEKVAEHICSVSLAAWHTLGCLDFVRVDLRMDEQEQLYILEINANPDISADAGFAAALTAGNMSFDEFVAIVITNAMERLKRRAAIPMQAQLPDKCAGDLTIRYTETKDRDEIVRLTENTGYFRPDEIAVACEVLDDALVKGPEGHYQSFTAESGGKAVGWICVGPTPCTVGTYDIYWIVVAPSCQRKGVGGALLRQAESLISSRSGRLCIIETSGKGLYDSTRDFYHKMGYSEQARITDFYAAGDDKIVFTKQLEQV